MIEGNETKPRWAIFVLCLGVDGLCSSRVYPFGCWPFRRAKCSATQFVSVEGSQCVGQKNVRAARRRPQRERRFGRTSERFMEAKELDVTTAKESADVSVQIVEEPCPQGMEETEVPVRRSLKPSSVAR